MYTPKLSLYPHQAKAVELMRNKPAFALLMAMRTGKTAALLCDYARRVSAGSGTMDLLVVAPGGVYKTWLGEVRKHVNIEDPALQDLQVLVWESGKNNKRDVESFIVKKCPRILIMNVEALSSVDRARDLAKRFLTDGRAMMAIDESTTIKNPRALRTKFINQTLGPLARSRRILSGLPTPRSPLDLFAQFEFLDWKVLGFRSYYSFRARYAVIKRIDFGGPRPVDVVVGYRNTEELQTKIRDFSFRVTLDQVRDAAPPVYMVREVSMTPEQKRIYEDMRTLATTQLETGDHVTATQVIVQILRLHQILCGHTVDETGTLHAIPENRTKTLLSVLEEYDGKAIIWCSYNYNIQMVASALEAEYGAGSVARFSGLNLKTREEEERAFKSDPNCRFMVATQAAGGRGRTWDMADLHVFYSNSYDLEHRDQAEQRAEGVQKAVQATRIDLVTPGTVDMKMLQTLRQKINLATTITGENFREWVI